MSDLIKAGLTKTIKLVVTEDTTAEKVGSGSLPVFSTPSMLAAMEKASLQAVEDYLDYGETTVGIMANIKHLAATKIGDVVEVKSEVINVEGKKISFNIKAFSSDKLIGEGIHDRFVVNSEKFMKKLLGE